MERNPPDIGSLRIGEDGIVHAVVWMPNNNTVKWRTWCCVYDPIYMDHRPKDGGPISCLWCLSERRRR